MKLRIRNSLVLRIGAIVGVIELLVLAAVGTVYVISFSRSVDQRIEAQVRMPALLMNAGLLDLDAVADAETMQQLVGEELTAGFVVGINGNVFYSLDPAFLGRNVAGLPGVDSRLFDKNDPREVIVRNPESYIVASPIFGSDGRTPRFFAYVAV